MKLKRAVILSANVDNIKTLADVIFNIENNAFLYWFSTADIISNLTELREDVEDILKKHHPTANMRDISAEYLRDIYGLN